MITNNRLPGPIQTEFRNARSYIRNFDPFSQTVEECLKKANDCFKTDTRERYKTKIVALLKEGREKLTNMAITAQRTGATAMDVISKNQKRTADEIESSTTAETNFVPTPSPTKKSSKGLSKLSSLIRDICSKKDNYARALETFAHLSPEEIRQLDPKLYNALKEEVLGYQAYNVNPIKVLLSSDTKLTINEKIEALELLVKAHAPVIVGGEEGEISISSLLLDTKVPINERISLLQALVHAGADINVPDIKEGNVPPPIILIMMDGTLPIDEKIKLVQALLRAGAKKTLESPMEGPISIITCLLGCTRFLPISDVTSLLQTLITEGCYVNEQDPSGKSPISSIVTSRMTPNEKISSFHILVKALTDLAQDQEKSSLEVSKIISQIQTVCSNKDNYVFALELFTYLSQEDRSLLDPELYNAMKDVVLRYQAYNVNPIKVLLSSDTNFTINERITALKLLKDAGVPAIVAKTGKGISINNLVLDTEIPIDEKINLLHALSSFGTNLIDLGPTESSPIDSLLSNRQVPINDKIRLLQALVDAKADVNALSSDGWPPISLLLTDTEIPLNDKISLLQALVDAKADVNVLNSDGWPPISLLLINPKVPLNDKISLLQALVDAGADVNVPLREGTTPLYNTSHNALKEILINAGADKKAALSQEALKHLSHAWGLVNKGTYRTESGRSIKMKLESAHNFITEKLLSRTLKNITKRKNKPDNAIWRTVRSQLDSSAQDLSALTDNSSPSTEEQYRDLGTKKPIFIVTGFTGHCIVIVLHKNELFVCNRGAGTEKIGKNKYLNGIAKYSIDRSSQNFPKALQRLCNHKSIKTSEEFNTIVNSIGTKSSERIDQKNQKAGNCTWASRESAILALLTIQKNGAKNFKLTEKVKKIYKSFTGLARKEALLTYLEEEHPDIQVLRAVREKAVNDSTHFSDKERKDLIEKIDTAIQSELALIEKKDVF